MWRKLCENLHHPVAYCKYCGGPQSGRFTVGQPYSECETVFTEMRRHSGYSKWEKVIKLCIVQSRFVGKCQFPSGIGVHSMRLDHLLCLAQTSHLVGFSVSMCVYRKI